MSLENDIKQKKFDDLNEKTIINILYTSSWIDATNIKRLKPFGLTPQQYNVLRILRGSYPNKLMLSDISSRMIDKNSNATRLVEKLRFKQLVTREVNKSSRRQVDIGITQKGLDLLAAIDNMASSWLNNFKNIDSQEANTLNLLLDKLRG
ncbi:MAG: MarR family transcriptional regulator [Bacteroidia bacterium]|jgi:DNA-binding MarR family transcriptional regulator|nr:MarR family transcriptional regulator [Bacteroidia bacterium]